MATKADLNAEIDSLKDSLISLESELAAIDFELDKHSTHDKGFPSVMRIKGLVDRYKALGDVYNKSFGMMSSDDARWASDILREATNIHGIKQTMGDDHYYLSNALSDYADAIEVNQTPS